VYQGPALEHTLEGVAGEIQGPEFVHQVMGIPLEIQGPAFVQQVVGVPTSVEGPTFVHETPRPGVSAVASVQVAIVPDTTVGPVDDHLVNMVRPSAGSLIDHLVDAVRASSGPILDHLINAIRPSAGSIYDHVFAVDVTEVTSGPVLDALVVMIPSPFTPLNPGSAVSQETKDPSLFQSSISEYRSPGVYRREGG